MWDEERDPLKEEGVYEVFTNRSEQLTNKLLGSSMRNEVDEVIAALRSGDDPDALPGGERRTALMWSAALGFPEVTRILALYSRVENTDPNGWTALHYAVRALAKDPPLDRAVEHMESVRALVTFGAPLEVKAKDGSLPIDFAAMPSIKKFLAQVSDLRKKGCKEAAMFTFGVGAFSRLGHGEDDNNESFPRQLEQLMEVRQVSCGRDHTACVTWNGDLWTWGDNREDKLGHAIKRSDGLHYYENNVVFPKKIVMYKWDDPKELLPGHYKIQAVDCGVHHTAAIEFNGDLMTWGGGSKGALGHGDEKNRLIPTKVMALNGKPLRQVCCGERFTCALDLSGDLYTFGYGNAGRCGHGNEDNVLLPKRIKPLEKQVRDMSAGIAHAGAVLKGGGIVTWGWSRDGQLGHGSTNDPVWAPKRVTFFDEMHMDYVRCGHWHTLAKTWDGAIYSWGKASVNGLGNPTNEDQLTPKVLDALICLNVVHVDAGEHCSAVITDSEELYTFGDLDHVSVIHGTEEAEAQVTTPQLITGFGIHHPYQVFCGEHHLGVITSEGHTGATMLAIGDRATAYLDRAMVHRIAIGGRKTMLELAFYNDFSLDVVDKFGNTPLHYAVLGKRMEIVRSICTTGCDLFVENDDGDTPFDVCRKLEPGNVDSPLMKILVDAAQRTHQTTEVNIAVMRGADDLEALLESGTCGDLNQWGEYDNRYPLMWAACFRRKRAVELLIEKGALTNAVEGDQGRSCLHFASDYTDCDPEIIRILLANGADLGQEDWKGRKPAQMEAVLDDVKEKHFYNRATLKTSLRTRVDTCVVPKAVGYDLLQKHMLNYLGVCPTIWIDLPTEPELQIFASNFRKVLDDKRAATKCPELILYIDAARLHRERRFLVTHDNMDNQNKIRKSKAFLRLCEMTRDDNLNIRREARRNLANLVGEKESHEIAGTKPPAHTMERDNVKQLRPPGGMGFQVEKLIEMTNKKWAQLEKKEAKWVADMKSGIERKIQLAKDLQDYQEKFDRLDVKLILTAERNVKTKKHLDIQKQKLADAEEALAEKKEKLQGMHKDSSFEADLRASGRVSMMGSVDGGRAGSVEGRGSMERASFRASVDGIRASLNEGVKSLEERQSGRQSGRESGRRSTAGGR